MRELRAAIRVGAVTRHGEGGCSSGAQPLDPYAAAIAAGREALKRTADYLDRELSFAVEATLSSRRRVELYRQSQIPRV